MGISHNPLSEAVFTDNTRELEDHEFSRLPLWADKAAYVYTYGGYEGRGIILATDGKGKWTFGNLGHCSCYGPLERNGSWPHYTKQEAERILEREMAEERYDDDEKRAYEGSEEMFKKFFSENP